MGHSSLFNASDCLRWPGVTRRLRALCSGHFWTNNKTLQSNKYTQTHMQKKYTYIIFCGLKWLHFCFVVLFFFLRWLVLANTRTLAFVFLLLQEAQWISPLGGCCRRMPHYTHTRARISRSVPRLTTLSGAYEALHRRLFNYNASLRGRNMYEHTRTPGQTDRKDRQGMLAFWNVANAPRWPQGTRWITCRASRTLLLAIAVCLLVVFVNLLLLHVARCLCYIVCASGYCL